MQVMVLGGDYTGKGLAQRGVREGKSRIGKRQQAACVQNLFIEKDVLCHVATQCASHGDFTYSERRVTVSLTMVEGLCVNSRLEHVTLAGE
jgi:hypothetical protein